jgi:hypothetical protein
MVPVVDERSVSCGENAAADFAQRDFAAGGGAEASRAAGFRKTASCGASAGLIVSRLRDSELKAK